MHEIDNPKMVWVLRVLKSTGIIEESYRKGTLNDAESWLMKENPEIEKNLLTYEILTVGESPDTHIPK